jgi:ribose transport system permease protein
MSQPDARTAPGTADRPRLDFSTYGPLIGLVLLFVVGAILNPTFASPSNISNVLTRTAIIGIVAVGATFVIISGGLDLSVGALLALQAGLAITVMNGLVGSLGSSLGTMLLGIVIAIGSGVVAGIFHGFLVTRGRIDPFIVTLGTAAIYRAVLTELAEGGSITFQNSDFDHYYSNLYYGAVLGVPVPILVFAVVALVGGLLLNRTRYGRYVQAIGSNESVARYSAINVDSVKLLTYVLQSVCVGIATVIYVAQLSSANSQTGIGWELSAIAAVIIGGTALKGGFGRISGTVVGAILLSTIANVLTITSLISEYLNPAVQGLIIIVVAFLQRTRRTTR